MQAGDVPFQKIVVIGLGLIGGSLCLALRRAFPKLLVAGVDQPEVIKPASATLDEVFTPDDLEKALLHVDLVFLATPIHAIVEYLPRVARSIPATALVSDVGSTKTQIVEAAQRAFAGSGHFVGGHPMTGKEITGWQNADASLFENAAYVLTPSRLSTPDALHRGFISLLQGIGARIFEMSPEMHDRLTAEVSHLPQLLAVALMNYVGREDAELAMRLQLTAGGFRDMTRIAASPFHIWQDILLTNKAAIKKSLKEFREYLTALELSVDDETIREKFMKANEMRARV